jgi:hypothetical protein
MNEKGYNGWTNYETWLIKLWMDNDEGSYHYWQDSAQEAYDDDHEDAASNLAETLKQIYNDNAPEVSGVYADLLNASLGEVDWHEIAESLLEDVEKEPETEEVSE